MLVSRSAVLSPVYSYQSALSTSSILLHLDNNQGSICLIAHARQLDARGSDTGCWGLKVWIAIFRLSACGVFARKGRFSSKSYRDDLLDSNLSSTGKRHTVLLSS